MFIFNRWRKYPRRKPKESKWYQCTIICGENCENRRVMDLYFNANDNTWLDLRRKNVFEGYKIYHISRAPIEENRYWSDALCDRTLAVIAWRKLPKPYGQKESRPLQVLL